MTDHDSGEATICLQEWNQGGRDRALGSSSATVIPQDSTAGKPVSTAPSTVSSSTGRGPFIPPNARRAVQARTLFEMGPPETPPQFKMDIVATDPVRFLLGTLRPYISTDDLVYLPSVLVTDLTPMSSSIIHRPSQCPTPTLFHAR
jgi:hypothetical protein